MHDFHLKLVCGRNSGQTGGEGPGPQSVRRVDRILLDSARRERHPIAVHQELHAEQLILLLRQLDPSDNKETSTLRAVSPEAFFWSRFAPCERANSKKDRLLCMTAVCNNPSPVLLMTLMSAPFSIRNSPKMAAELARLFAKANNSGEMCSAFRNSFRSRYSSTFVLGASREYMAQAGSPSMSPWRRSAPQFWRYSRIRVEESIHAQSIGVSPLKDSYK